MNKNKLVQSAQKYIAKGQYKKAIGEYEKIVKEDPQDIRVRLKLADLYLRQKETDRAVEEFLGCAQHYEKQGFMQKAVSVYKQVIGVSPERTDLYVALGENYQKLGRNNDATAQFQGALALLEKKGDQPGKLGVVQKMLDMDADNVTDRVRLAEAFAKDSQQVEAIKELRSAVSVLDRMREEDSALEHDFQLVAERYLFFKSDDAQVSKRLALSYVRGDRPELALAKLKTAYRKQPHDMETLGVVAQAFDLLGQTHKAVTVYREMGRQYKKSGLDAEMRDCLSAILRIDPTDEQARQAMGDNEGHVAGQTIEFDTESAAKAAGSPGGGPPPPPGAPAGKPDSLVEDMIAQASGAAAKAPVPAPPAAPVAKAPPAPPIAPPPIAPPPVVAPAVVAAPVDSDDDLDFDEDDDDDDDLGFGDEGVGEKTLVDNLFIPDDVLADVQAGLDWSAPAAQEEQSPEDRKVREDLRELDFYVKNGLKDEAQALLDELVKKHGQHDELVKRQEALSKM